MRKRHHSVSILVMRVNQNTIEMPRSVGHKGLVFGAAVGTFVRLLNVTSVKNVV